MGHPTNRPHIRQLRADVGHQTNRPHIRQLRADVGHRPAVCAVIPLNLLPFPRAVIYNVMRGSSLQGRPWDDLRV